MNELSTFEEWWINSLPHRLRIKRHVPRFLKACPEPLRGEVLEVGAGSGWTSQQILETFPQVELTATDLRRQAITHLHELQRKYGQRLKVKEADVAQLPFDRESFDVVVAISLLHFVADPTRAVQQLLRVVRPGGLVGISDTDRKYNWSVSRPNAATRATLEQILNAEDCEVLFAAGRQHYYLWARKPFPLSPSAPNA